MGAGTRCAGGHLVDGRRGPIKIRFHNALDKSPSTLHPVRTMTPPSKAQKGNTQRNHLRQRAQATCRLNRNGSSKIRFLSFSLSFLLFPDVSCCFLFSFFLSFIFLFLLVPPFLVSPCLLSLFFVFHFFIFPFSFVPLLGRAIIRVLPLSPMFCTISRPIAMETYPPPKLLFGRAPSQLAFALPSDRRSITSHRISAEFWVSYVFNLMLLSTSWFCSSRGNCFLNAAILRSSSCFNLGLVSFLFVNMFVLCLPTSQRQKLSVRHLQCSIVVSNNFCMH